MKSCKSLLLRKKPGIHGITSYATGQDILASQRNSNMNEEWNFPLVFSIITMFVEEKDGGKNDHRAWF